MNSPKKMVVKIATPTGKLRLYVGPEHKACAYFKAVSRVAASGFAPEVSVSLDPYWEQADPSPIAPRRHFSRERPKIRRSTSRPKGG